MSRPLLQVSPATRSYRFGDFELDGARGELRRGGERVAIEPKALDVLAHLVEHRDRTIPIEELLAIVWDGVAVERGSVHRSIRLLRRALDAGECAIATTPRRGYRFVLDAHEIAAAGNGASDAEYVGRIAICDQLDRHLERALDGQVELILVHGPAGIGKSATLTRIARTASSAGAAVFAGTCLEGPGAPPYRPWARILAAAIRTDGAADVALGLGGGIEEVAHAMPEIDATLALRGASRRGRVRGGRDRIHAAVADWIRHRCRRQALVLLLDDLHRADLDSLQLLLSLARELDGVGLLIAGSHRDGPDRDAIRDAIAELASLRPDGSLRLGALAAAELREIAALRSGRMLADAELEHLADASGGNPLLAEQLLRLSADDRAAQGRPTASLHGVLRRLLEDCSASCTEMLSQACVFGRELAAAVVATALGWSHAQLQITLAEARDRNLVEAGEGGIGFRFVHGRIPELLYAQLPAGERIERHRRAAEAIEATRAHTRDRIGELAHHAREAAAAIGMTRAFEYTVAAAREARDRLAYQDAIESYEAALALRERGAPGAPARAACLIELGDVMILVGDAVAARARFSEAGAIARELGDAVLFARAALGPSEVEEYREFEHEQVAVLRDAIAGLGDREPALRVPLLIALGRTGYYREPELFLEATADALTVARAHGEPSLVCRGALARAAALGWYDSAAACRALVDEAERIARRCSVSPLLEGDALRLAARERLAAGDRAGFQRQLRALELLAAAHRLSVFDWTLLAMQGTLALLEGRFAEARAIVERQLERGSGARPLLAFQVAAVQGALLELALGTPAEVIDNMRALAERFPEVSPWRSCLALALSTGGRHDEARTEIDAMLRRGLHPRHRDFLPIVLAALAEAVQQLGDRRLAGVLAGELARIEDRVVVVAECLASYGAVDRYRGLCAETTGDLAAAIGFYEAGLALDEAMGALPFVARGSADLGRALHRRGAPGDATAAERARTRAAALAAQIGMHSLDGSRPG